LLSLRFRAWEALLIAALLDVTWLPSDSFFHIPFFTLIALLIVWGLEPLRLQILE